MEEVTRFQTRDGEVFETREEAEYNEAILDAGKWYESHPIYSTTGVKVSFNELLLWLENNAEYMYALLNKFPK